MPRRKKKYVKVVHVHHYHHGNPDAHPFWKDPNNPDRSGELHIGKLLDKLDNDPKGTIRDFLLYMLFT